MDEDEQANENEVERESNQAEREVIQDLVREECTEYLELSQSDLDDPENLVHDCDDLEVSKA